MNPADPLSQLKDIHLPDAPGLWPLAPGWWILIVLLIALVSAAIYLVISYRRKNRYRKLATRQAEIIFTQFRLTDDKTKASKQYIELALSLLKQVSLHRFPDDPVAALSASQCLQQLNQHCKKATFSDEICTQFEHSLYAAPPSSQSVAQPTSQPVLDIPSFHQTMEEWIKHHR
ncbi:MAG: DUF4381 domain-containing protein [Pseudomonadales bacterium]|nr:DUF4381 domain-containing protein [Pseudomonadales bacterium]